MSSHSYRRTWRSLLAPNSRYRQVRILHTLVQIARWRIPMKFHLLSRSSFWLLLLYLSLFFLALLTNLGVLAKLPLLQLLGHNKAKKSLFVCSSLCVCMSDCLWAMQMWKMCKWVGCFGKREIEREMRSRSHLARPPTTTTVKPACTTSILDDTIGDGWLLHTYIEKDKLIFTPDPSAEWKKGKERKERYTEKKWTEKRSGYWSAEG